MNKSFYQPSLKDYEENVLIEFGNAIWAKIKETNISFKNSDLENVFWVLFKKKLNFTEKNYYEIPNCRMELDKDILIKNNKIYQPNACCFVPQEINSLLVSKNLKTVKHHFNKNTSPTNQELPVGVTWCNDKNKYRASLNLGKGVVKNLGRFNTIQEAFECYKQAKENRIKEVANQYKDNLPLHIYNALINFKIEIND